MRKINWDEKLTDEDIAWLRASGVRSEEQIAAHQAQFDADVPEEDIPGDEATQSALDPNSRANTPAETGDGPQKVDPTQADPQDVEPDDYDSWTTKELNDEIEARNGLADTSMVEVVGTGKNGAITNADRVKALRLWDTDNPDALKD